MTKALHCVNWFKRKTSFERDFGFYKKINNLLKYNYFIFILLSNFEIPYEIYLTYSSVKLEQERQIGKRTLHFFQKIKF